MDEMMTAIRRQFGYMLSLPERTIRSLAALASGTTSLLTDTLLPETLRESSFYKVLVGDMQRFVSQQIAEVPPEPGTNAPDPTASPDYVQRKMFGSALDTAGLLAMHMSPLWVLALAGDAAAGGNTFLNRLVDQLKKNHVIPEQTQITGLTDLLGAVQEASRRSAVAVETPPLSRQDLSKLASDMTDSYRQMFAKARNLMPRLDDVWSKINELATREKIALQRISGALAVDAAEVGRKGVGAVLAVGQTGADLVGDKILTSYAHTLNEMTEQGVSNYISSQMKPFLQAAVSHFDPQRASWTERKLGLSEEPKSGISETSVGSEPFPPPPPHDPPLPDQFAGSI